MVDDLPALMAAQPQGLQYSVCSIESYDLTVTDILHHRKCHQDHDVLQLGIAPQCDLLQHHRSHGKQRAISHGQQKEQQENLQRSAQQEETDGDEHKCSERLHNAPADLDKEMEGHAQHAGSAVSRIENHVTISHERLGHAKLPATSLAGKHAQGSRRLSPANRVRSKNDAELPFLLSQVTTYGGDHVNVFRYRIVAEAAGADHRFLMQNTESPRGNERSIQHVPTRTAEHESSYVFHNLAQFQPARGQ